MSYPIFYVPAGDVLPIMFDSFAGATGASITMTGLAVTDIEIYKDGSITQRASDAGYTLLDTDGIDFDAITGIHGFSIDTGDNTDAGFYTVGAWFTVVVSAITIDAQTVNFIAAQFRLMPAETVAGVPKVDPNTWDGTDITTGVPLAPTTAGRTLDVTAANKVNGVVLVDTVTTYTGNTPQTGDAFARIGAAGAGLTAADDAILAILGTPAGASLAADIDALPTSAEIFTAVLTTALTEAYAADGVAPTLAQAIFLVQQSLHEFAIAATTRTVKKLDGVTTAATFTLDDATNPTSTTRAT